MKNTGRLIALLLLQTALTGCGFHLRGVDVGVKLANVDVLVINRGSSVLGSDWATSAVDAMPRRLRETLRVSGANVVDTDLLPATAKTADGKGTAVTTTTTEEGKRRLTIELLNESVSRRIASVDASASAGEYEVDYALTFRVTGSDGATIIPETALKSDTSYRYKSNAIMGSAEEEMILYRELQDDIATQLLRRLDAALSKGSAVQTPASGSTHADHH